MHLTFETRILFWGQRKIPVDLISRVLRENII